jgi:hypothetical protein
MALAVALPFVAIAWTHTRAEGIAADPLAFPHDAEVARPKVYATQLNLTENPISERGAWSHRAGGWTHVRTMNGTAQGTQTGTNGYDDSYSLLSGFPADQGAVATVRQSPDIDKSCTHEVELLLRVTDSQSTVRGYEVNLSFDGLYIQIIRWNGAKGDFEVLGDGAYPGFRDGDTFSATVIGNTITAYVNGALVAQATDDEIASGNPGMGFFRRQCGSNDDMSLTRYLAYGIR